MGNGYFQQINVKKGMFKYFLPVFLFAALLSDAQTSVPMSRHVILITIDGMRPEFYLDPAWPAPNLQHLMQEGAYAIRMRPVFPTVTLPNHTTMITGALPARHGVYYNGPFNPLATGMAWNFFASVIRVPTLFDAVHAEGKVTVAIDWPVTVGSPSIDYNFPDYWGFSDTTDNIALIRNGVHPAGLWEELEKNALGIVPSEEINSDHFLRTDENAGRIAAYLIRTYKPTFTAFHITETDHAQHEVGREGYAVRIAVAAADRAIGSVLEAVERAGIKDSTTIIIAGDHGFANIHSVLFPNVWLAQAGLFQKGANWRVKFQSASGSCFLYLQDRKDVKTLAAVKDVLARLPEKYRGLFRVLERPELDRLGVDSAAFLALAPLPGIAIGNSGEGEVLRGAHGGTHGFMNDEPEMMTGFIAFGVGIRKGVIIHEMATQQIAPLIVQLLGLSFTCPDGVLYPGLLQ
jgi:predicted AlkP superfamily pyrophosphatase or phosphodiesterase